VPDGRGQRSPEHDVQLREPEDEGIALIDQHDVTLVAELFGQPGRQLKAAESRTKDHDTHNGEPIGRARGTVSRGQPGTQRS
jgi:hypothetical protein